MSALRSTPKNIPLKYRCPNYAYFIIKHVDLTMTPLTTILITTTIVVEN
jgi:hypothetical protein